MRKIIITIKILSIIFVVICLSVFSIDSYVKSQGSKYIVPSKEAPESDAILVLGAYVFPNGRVSDILNDRLKVALEVYDQSKTPKILVSGDHGQVKYDEVNAMKNYMLNHHIKDEDIFMDHAGFSTYESIYRAKEIFKVKKVVIVTQEYHLKRAIYIARQMGLEAYGVASDKHVYTNIEKFKMREIAARCKDFFFVNVFKPDPTYLGEAIPISSDGRLTNDKY